MRARGLIRIGCLAAALFALPAAQAAESCDRIRAEGPSVGTLRKLAQGDCLGLANDDDPDVRAVRASLESAVGVELKGAERLARVRAIVIYLQGALERRAAGHPPPPGVALDPLRLFAAEMATARAQLEADGRSPVLTASHWQLDLEDGQVGALYDFCADLLREACRSPELAVDADRFRLAEEVVRQAELMKWVSGNAAGAELAEFTREIGKLQEMWRQYAVEARSQTPIELWINSWRFDAAKATDGFARPPDRQIIALHPSVAMEYLAHGESRFEPALMVEWIGINRWWWAGGEEPRMEHPIGLSLISTYSERDGARDVGHGLVAHYRHVYSLGVTRHGGDTGVFVSLDLQKLLTDPKTQLKAVRKFFRVLH